MSTRRSHYRRHNNINNLHQHRTIDADEPVKTWKRVRAIPNYFNPNNNNNNNKSGIDGTLNATSNGNVNGNGNLTGDDNNNENDEETRLSNKFLVPQWIPADEDEDQESRDNSPAAEEDDGDKDDYLEFEKIIISAREQSKASNHPDAHHGQSNEKDKRDDSSKLTAADIRGAVGGEEIPGMVSSGFSSNKKEAQGSSPGKSGPSSLQPQQQPQSQDQPPQQSETVTDMTMPDAPKPQKEPSSTANDHADHKDRPILAGETKETTDAASQGHQADQEMPDAIPELQPQPQLTSQDDSHPTEQHPAVSQSQSAETKESQET